MLLQAVSFVPRLVELAEMIVVVPQAYVLPSKYGNTNTIPACIRLSYEKLPESGYKEYSWVKKNSKKTVPFCCSPGKRSTA
jgi:hypothetical protein